MKWTIITANAIAAMALLILGNMALSAHRTDARTVYIELQEQGLLIERPGYDVHRRLSTIGTHGSYSSTIARVGAGACLVNALAVAFYFRRPQRRRAAAE